METNLERDLRIAKTELVDRITFGWPANQIRAKREEVAIIEHRLAEIEKVENDENGSNEEDEPEDNA